ncbi:hypothetical protein D3C80_2099110 [compost metagenome]
MKLPILRGQFNARLSQFHRTRAHLVEVAADALRRAFDEGNAAIVNGVKRTGSHFLGLGRIFGADLPMLGNMQPLDGTGAE